MEILSFSLEHQTKSTNLILSILFSLTWHFLHCYSSAFIIITSDRWMSNKYCFSFPLWSSVRIREKKIKWSPTKLNPSRTERKIPPSTLSFSLIQSNFVFNDDIHWECLDRWRCLCTREILNHLSCILIGFLSRIGYKFAFTIIRHWIFQSILVRHSKSLCVHSFSNFDPL